MNSVGVNYLFTSEQIYLFQANFLMITCLSPTFFCLFFLILRKRYSAILSAMTAVIAIHALRALLCIRTADTFLPALFCAYDIEHCKSHDKNDGGDSNNIRRIHRAILSFPQLKAYAALSCLFFSIIKAVNRAAIAATMHHPRTGIQAAPKLPPVKSVPKKKTRNPTVYPTAN